MRILFTIVLGLLSIAVVFMALELDELKTQQYRLDQQLHALLLKMDESEKKTRNEFHNLDVYLRRHRMAPPECTENES